MHELYYEPVEWWTAASMVLQVNSTGAWDIVEYTPPSDCIAAEAISQII